jgi:hypothetical protein
MGKAPAEQFYWGDYIRDTRSLNLMAKGAWSDILAHGFFKTPFGRISQSLDDWATMFGCDVATAKTVLEAIKKHQVGDVVTQRNGDITVTNRRRFREWKEKEAANNRQKRFRDRHGGNEQGDASRENNGKVTALSSSSSSTSLKRLIAACVREHAGVDARLVEIAVLETLIRRKGSANENQPIKSAKYFSEEIVKLNANAGKGGKMPMGDQAIDVMLKRRREQVEGRGE